MTATWARLEFGSNKAIQSLVVERKTDGSITVGVTVWIPTGQTPQGYPAYRAIVCTIDLTNEQRKASIESWETLLATLKGDNEREEKKRDSATGEVSGALGSVAPKPDHKPSRTATKRNPIR